MNRLFCTTTFSILIYGCALAIASSPDVNVQPAGHVCRVNGEMTSSPEDPRSGNGSAYLGTGYDPYVEKAQGRALVYGEQDRGLKLDRQVLQRTATPGCCVNGAVCRAGIPSRIILSTTTNSTETVVTMNLTIAQVFGRAEASYQAFLLLTPDFVAAACSLPKFYASNSPEVYYDFFRAWGTEVLLEFEMAVLEVNHLTANKTVLSNELAGKSSADLSDFMMRAEGKNVSTDSLDGIQLKSVMNKTVAALGLAVPVTPAFFPSRTSEFLTKPISRFFKKDYLASSVKALSVDCPLLNDTKPGEEPDFVLWNLGNATKTYAEWVSRNGTESILPTPPIRQLLQSVTSSNPSPGLDIPSGVTVPTYMVTTSAGPAAMTGGLLTCLALMLLGLN